MYVTVKGQATRKKPWRQGKTAPTILQMEKLRKEERSKRTKMIRIRMDASLQFSE